MLSSQEKPKQMTEFISNPRPGLCSTASVLAVRDRLFRDHFARAIAMTADRNAIETTWGVVQRPKHDVIIVPVGNAAI